MRLAPILLVPLLGCAATYTSTDGRVYPTKYTAGDPDVLRLALRASAAHDIPCVASQVSAAASPVVSSESVLFIPPAYATTVQHGGFYLAEGCGKRVTYALDGDGRLVLVAEVALQRE